MEDCKLVECDLYPGYLFSSEGKIYTRYHSKEWIEMKPFVNSCHMGYLRIRLKNNLGKFKKEHLHRIIAKVFIPNPFNLPCVNHKDENIYNNDISNLEWCTYTYNNAYGNHVQNCRKGILKAAENRQIPVIAISKDGKQQDFESMEKAAEATGTYAPNIRQCLLNQRKTAGGYTWKKKSMK